MLMTTPQHMRADGSRVGRSSDVWSLGIILYEIIVGHPPFAHCKNICQKITAITTGPIQFPKVSNAFALDVMKLCLNRSPEKRPSISELLGHPFLSSRAAKASTDALRVRVSETWIASTILCMASRRS